ncbi:MULTISPECIES: hypothetical protein [Xanthomonas]|uniref:hypothetical protein n=1 Tax=Xanthomonas TaxID=338 RepID=UPI002367DA95|nr:hypothetical protein [Xanthomonas campestris]MEB1409564.1 hypothetical protein [Xanthomonas campestris pv. campestris]MEB1510804.1 hypothetical protein [Xanthomonas campestris pv. campestris]MEB1763576.1 hypothetical protein [Xanthomonas campestris pv. campestris]MEB1874086.1 hypothetical protein [Xanthomonas campestris pv. campestris]MEB1909850.1 hypothetical protein [Xanthomonas campestris pv. campestris]
MTHNEAITAPETSPQLVSIPPQVIQAAAIASAGGAVEWNLLSARAQLEAHADCEVIILAAFSALRQAGVASDGSDESTITTIRRFRAALELIATQGPHFGHDGKLETWVHWSDIARKALTDQAAGYKHLSPQPDQIPTISQQQEPSYWTKTLLASAQKLRARTGVQRDGDAEDLERLAAAIRAPNGYIVKVGGAAYRYDLCASTAAYAREAALAKGLEAENFTVEPFLVIHP